MYSFNFKDSNVHIFGRFAFKHSYYTFEHSYNIFNILSTYYDCIVLKMTNVHYPPAQSSIHTKIVLSQKESKENMQRKGKQW
jgi:hypothetical protein